MTPQHHDIKEMILCSILGIVILLLLPMLFLVPPFRDQGIFSWVAMEILKGGLPYVDAWDVKGPAVGFTYALPMAIFGLHTWSTRLIDLVLIAGGLYFAYGAVAMFSGRVNAWMTLLLLLACSRFSFHILGQPDLWVAWLLVTVLSLLIDPRYGARRSSFIVAGLAVGWMAMVKPFYGLFILPLLWTASLRRQVFVLLASAAVLPFLFVFLYMTRNGGMEALIDVQVFFNLGVPASLSPSSTGFGPFVWTPKMLLLEYWVGAFPMWVHDIIMTMAFVSLVLLFRRDRRTALLCGIAFIMGVVCLVLQRKYFDYHFLPCMLLAALMMGLALPFEKKTGFVFGLFLVMLWVVSPLLTSVQGVTMLLSSEQRAEWQHRFITMGFNSPDTEDAARMANHLTEPGETIYVWGFEALIYFLADRLPPTRLGFNYPMLVGSDDFKAARKAELLAALEAHPPQVILVQDGDASILSDISSKQALEQFPALQKIITQDYVQVYQNMTYQVYHRR